MIYFFCSAARALYKRDALEVLAYPNGHLFRFRYDQSYVMPDLRPRKKDLEHCKGYIVFADTIGQPRNMDFNFFPLRTVRDVRLSRKAEAVYADFRLGEFFNYGVADSRKNAWDRFLKSVATRPWPPPEKSGRPQNEQGYFVTAAADLPDAASGSEVPYGDWHSVVRRLDDTADLAGSTFYLVQGFHRVRRRFWLFGPWLEESLASTDNGYYSMYPIPMGTSVVLKVLLARPKIDYNLADSRRRMRIVAGGEVFSGLSKDVIYSESRYNEDKTVLVCKRVFDTAVSAVSIREDPDQVQIRTPQITLVTRVKVPRGVVTVVVIGVTLSAFLLGLDSDVLRFVAEFLNPHSKKIVADNAKAIAAIGKMFAPVPVAVSAYVAFKRLPIK